MGNVKTKRRSRQVNFNDALQGLRERGEGQFAKVEKAKKAKADREKAREEATQQRAQEVIRAARADFLSGITAERGRQISKWGDGFPDPGGFDTMAAVLSEESGEVARAILDGDRANLRVELIQTAAVCCRMYEQLVRGESLRSSNKAQLAGMREAGAL